MTFELPAGVDATRPPATRDGVRLLVARADGIEHARFAHLARFLTAGDLLVVNTSATLPAAVAGVRARGDDVTVHFSTALDDGDWVVEVRPQQHAVGPVPDARTGEVITLAGGARLVVGRPHPAAQRRLWRATIGVEGDLAAYLYHYGKPIRYRYASESYPLREYQTVFARTPGSAEMPSAGRPFTTELVTELVASGVGFAPVSLHTGVSSQEAGEPPQPERFDVPETTARLVNATQAWGGRVVAVGTTVTRALESAADHRGVVRGRGGWTELVLGSARQARVVTGLITGWHAPGTSHLALLEAVAGADLVDRAYTAALQARYLWHEFGDSCLLLP